LSLLNGCGSSVQLDGELRCLFTQANVKAASMEYNESFVARHKFTSNYYVSTIHPKQEFTSANFSQEREEDNALQKTSKSTNKHN
jgi:hypothetical protein